MANFLIKNILLKKLIFNLNILSSDTNIIYLKWKAFILYYLKKMKR